MARSKVVSFTPRVNPTPAPHRPNPFQGTNAECSLGRIRHEADFRLVDGGTIFILTPLNETAVAWVEEHVDRSGFHPDWPELVIEPRYLTALADGIFDDGLEISTGAK